MKIDYAGKSLCSGKGIDSPDKFSYQGERSEQVSRFLRAAQVIVRDRGNQYTTITFDVVRSLGTVQAAEKFALTHQASLPTYGTLQLTCDDGSATVTSVIYLAKALLKSVKVKYEGMLTTASYTFTGGTPTSAKPTS